LATQTIQIKRGLKSDLPILEDGEMGFCKDTKEVFIGDGTVNTLVNENKSYTHNQISPASEWAITHNLGKYPSVDVVDSGGNLVIGDVEFINSNKIVINFNAAFAGTAYLN